MKYLALALALLLAVGSHAAPAPVLFDQITKGIDDVRETAQGFLDALDNTEYAVHKTQLTQWVENLYTHMKPYLPTEDQLRTVTGVLQTKIEAGIDYLKNNI